LADKNIKHIYSTDYIRTRSTAAPTADAAGLTIEIYDPKNHDELVEQIRNQEGNVLIVGHSNTVNQVANYFVGEGEKYDDLTDLEYDNIFEVILEGKSSTVTRRLYKDF
jgi:broad specificity phosphatase PhoE